MWADNLVITFKSNTLPFRKAGKVKFEYQTPWSVVECGGVWWSVVECGGVWWSVVECGGVWWSVVECGGVWWRVRNDVTHH